MVEYYKTKEELAEAFNEALGTTKTFDDWVEYLEEECEGESGAIKIVDRGGEQVYPYATAQEEDLEEEQLI